MLEDSVYDPDKPITVGAAERRPVTSKDEAFFEKVAGEGKRRMWYLWTETFTADWDANFDPWETEVESSWLLKEENGNEWLLWKCDAGLLESHWKCSATLRWGEPLIS
jgi:hypothetical protein